MRTIWHVCRGCGKTFKGRRSRAFCSIACFHANRPPWDRAARKPRTVFKRKTGQYKICPYCKRLFYVKKSQSIIKFCSMKCYHTTRWKGSRVLTHPCPICGKIVSTVQSEMRVCCSWACRSKWMSVCRRGAASHFWRGGATAPYTNEWKEQRRRALDRDHHQCCKCGTVKKLNVHHIIPYRYYNSHALNNLVTLCRSCHSKAEYITNGFVQKALRDGRRKRNKIP